MLRIFCLPLCLWLSLLSARAEVKIVPGQFGLDIVGEVANFDPKSQFVYVRKPKRAKAPVLLYIHGGAGYGLGDRKVSEFFQTLGFATVAFDAFKLNKIKGLSPRELSVRVSLEAKQKMLTPVTEGALNWILKQGWADDGRVYIYGHSNGARVALYMAGRVSNKHVKLVIAEAPAFCCVPLPKTLTVPVKLLFGDKDNYGGHSGSDLLYSRRSVLADMTTEQWVASQRSSGLLELKVYSGGHGLFLGKNVPGVKARGTEWRLGGDSQAVMADIKGWVTNP